MAATPVILAGVFVITGGRVSITLTVKLVLAELPLRSEAEQITVEVPMGKMLPLAGTQVTGRGPSTVSMAVGLV